ncbi:MAG: DUF1850 domain-containing protein [Bacillaceae bacterium]|nr:DUF1850 domain-containing protein [Bacillaceae bacterium]
MNKKIFILLITLITITASFYPIQVFSVTTDNEPVYIFPAGEGFSFSVRWIHSVEEEEWEEFFVVKDGSIILDATRFKTFGAGVPHNAGKDAFLKDGWLYMIDIDRLIGGELYVRTGPETNHRLFINGKANPLSKPGENVAYLMKVDRQPFLIYFKSWLISKRR